MRNRFTSFNLKRSGPEGGGPSIYRSGDSSIVVYESEYAGTQLATAVTWSVGAQLETVVRTLQQAGSEFEHDDLPGARRDGDIHIFGNFRAAWFKNSDGNILHINSA